MPRTIRLSTENNVFQHVETLRRNREKRHRHREFFVEGVRPINQALAYGWEVRAFFHAESSRLSRWAQDMLIESQAEVHYEVAAPLLAKLSDRHEGSELLAIVRMPSDDLSRIPYRPDLCVVAFDRPGNPGNLGTILRSIDALGGHGLIVVGHAVDVYDPEVIRASTGSFFAVPIVRVPNVAEVAQWLAELREEIGPVPLVGTSEAGTSEAREFDFRGPVVLAMGNETHGLSRAFEQLCNMTVRIPMVGSASSLNVAAATSILLYEVDCQRRWSMTATALPS